MTGVEGALGAFNADGVVLRRRDEEEVMPLTTQREACEAREALATADLTRSGDIV